MKNRAGALKIISILVKIALCLAAMIAIDLAVNYMVNLQPDSDGFYICTFWARTIHGDIGWTWEELTRGLTLSAQITGLLIALNTVLDVAVIAMGGQRPAKPRGE